MKLKSVENQNMIDIVIDLKKDNLFCDCCSNLLDDFSEHGTCFDCLMYCCTAGQYN